MRPTDRNVGYGLVPRNKKNYPRLNSEFAQLDDMIDNFLLDALPIEITKHTKFFTQGSCFAKNLYEEIRARGYSCYHHEMTEALNSPLANAVFLTSLRHGKGNQKIVEKLQAADIMILTVGVASVYSKRETGEFVFFPDLKNLGDYTARTLTVHEVINCLHKVFECIYFINPNLSLVLTLSPVPLGSTFEFKSAIEADCVSKTVLRAGIHEALQTFEGKLPFYFPSFEIVRWIGGHVGDAFGDDGLPRHVSAKYVSSIISAFFRRCNCQAD